MTYRAQLIDLILDENENAMMDWILSQPLIEQPDIFRELKELAEELALENGDDINEEVDGFDSFGTQIDNYQEIILDEKLAEANYIMALADQEKAANEIDEAIDGIRDHVIECIVTNAPNAADMREVAKQMIKLEIDAGTYKTENWSAIQ